MRSKLIYIIFAIAVLMAGILLAISLAEPVANAGGAAHPDFPGMQIGGDGAARLEHIGLLGFTFQCLLLSQIILLSLLGIAERHRTTDLFVYMGGTMLFTLFIGWQMYSGHTQYLDTGRTGYFMGFPTATAWQLYGTWLGAIPLVIIYSLGFRKYIYTPQDEEKFQQLLSEKAQERTRSEQ
ncbi:MAG: hypothetical protein O2971_07250 [Proteobacteria bacterium]|nr:hypothetical protein [Pseudomonadota bacterium]